MSDELDINLENMINSILNTLINILYFKISPPQ